MRGAPVGSAYVYLGSATGLGAAPAVPLVGIEGEEGLALPQRP